MKTKIKTLIIIVIVNKSMGLSLWKEAALQQPESCHKSTVDIRVKERSSGNIVPDAIVTFG